MNQLEKDDIQGLVLSGYPKLPSACYLLLQVREPRAARAWLAQLATRVTNAERRTEGTALNVALSAAGLGALGIGKDVLGRFPPEFQEGMAGTDHRARILGDTDASAPETWDWGKPGATVVHVLMMLYAASEGELARLRAQEQVAYEGSGLGLVYARDTFTLDERKEHFGFHDGMSQPRIAGSGASPKPGSPAVAAGEFLLGYDNQYEELAAPPLVPASLDVRNVLAPAASDGGQREFGRNGSYLVARQLQQDVEGFWRAMDERSRASDGSFDRDAAVRLAAKCVGRGPSGAPLVASPDRDDPRLGDLNDFGYYERDRRGLSCPIGSHIRRSNPRDSLEPGPKESLEAVSHHLLLRRGRSYGPPLPPFEPDRSGAERGLFFVCLNANIRRQFEFVQHTWLNNCKFGGLYEDRDPVLGAHEPAVGGTFTIPGHPVRTRLTKLERFVRVRGGEYFFLPSLRALAFLGHFEA